MKHYATLVTTDVAQPWSMINPSSYGDLSVADRSGTLDDFIRRGWNVIASAIRVDQCGRDNPQYHFILERDDV